jgi:nucleoside-diphosphate-sugar epimerase
MRVLVTGASGRLGPYVVRDLLEHGYEVVMMSRSKPLDEFDDLTWVQGDLRNYEACKRAVDGVDAVQHIGAMAWPSDHPNSRGRAEERGIPFDATMMTNVMGTYYLIQAAVEAGVGTFVMAGSNCAIGIGSRISGRPFPVQYLPMDEEHPVFCEDSYAWTKFAGEELLRFYSDAYGIRTHVTRLAGIRQPDGRKQMAENAGPATWWDTFWCSWVGSEDVASAHRLLMEKAEQLPVHGVYFTNADDTAFLDPSRDLIAKFRPDLLPLAEGLDGNEPFFSNRKLKDATGWEQKTSWRDLI